MAGGRFHGSHGSPGSRSSRSHMPAIAEHEAPYQTPSPASRLPRTSLRVPQKVHQSSPPPYVPVTDPSPPRYKASAGLSDSVGTSSSDSKTELKGGQEMEQAEGSSSGWLKRWTDKQWFGSRKKRWSLFILLGLLLVAIAVGLSVGLALGLRNGSSGDNDDNETGSQAFPAGSYSFKTTLQRNSSSCTSRSTTWRCYPFADGSDATFTWIIDSRNSSGADSPSYTVSSSENPFAPSFTNLTATLLGKDSPDERLSFSFEMDRTVVPSDSLTPANRAASCTFSDTKIEATLWLRRKDGEELDPKEFKSSSNFGTWPADVEVFQSKEMEQGEPRCQDGDGNVIADVQAGAGDCVCGYASFELE